MALISPSPSTCNLKTISKTGVNRTGNSFAGFGRGTCLVCRFLPQDFREITAFEFSSPGPIDHTQLETVSWPRKQAGQALTQAVPCAWPGSPAPSSAWRTPGCHRLDLNLVRGRAGGSRKKTGCISARAPPHRSSWQTGEETLQWALGCPLEAHVSQRPPRGTQGSRRLHQVRTEPATCPAKDPALPPALTQPLLFH